MGISIGMQAPEFELKDQNEVSHKLSDFKGNRVVLYFYPKDFTPGCTAEACSFRDNFSVFKENGITILGISPNDSKSHVKFEQKYHLPFTLLADVDHHVSELYGVWGLKRLAGHEFMGVRRTTFVLDESGKVLKVFEKVKPEHNSTEILALFGLQPVVE